MTVTTVLTPAEQRRADEAEATRTEECSHCGARPNRWCTARTSTAHPYPAPHPHKARMKAWRARMAARPADAPTTVIVKCAGPVGPGFDNPLRDPTGFYLASYDPDAASGFGCAAWTDDPAEAMQFPTPAAARALWMTVPQARPVVAGRPNRPLTTFRLETEPLPLWGVHLTC